MGRFPWNGRLDLKRDVLAQLRSHREIGRLLPIEIGGETIEILGWPGPANLPALHGALGLPVSLLSLGFFLFDGFPENADGIRDLIDAKIAFLDAIPVGMNVDGVVREFVVWRLVENEIGLTRSIDDAATRAHVEAVALAIACGQASDRAPIEATLAEWRAEIPRQWQRDRRVEPKVYQHVRVLEAALLASDLRTEPALAGRFADTSMYGAFGVGVEQSDQQEDAMCAKLLDLLAAAGRGEVGS